MSARDPDRYRPVFLLAPARSCSSLVVTMLGQHPALYGFPELRLFRVETVAGLLVNPPVGRGMPARERAAGLLRALAELHEGTQSPAAADRAWAWLRDRADWDVEDVLDRLLALVAPRVGVEKSPETTLTDTALCATDRAYPSARYVHLVRHPWATVASMVTTWGRLSYWDVPRNRAPEFCAGVWLEQHRRIAAFGARVGPERLVRVRAEDAVNRAGTVLPWLCRWLGVDASAASVAQMVAPERSPYASPGPAGADGGFDPSFLRRPARRDVPLPTSLAPPPSWRIAGPARQAVADLARSFGYRDEIPPRRGLGLAARPRAEVADA